MNALLGFSFFLEFTFSRMQQLLQHYPDYDTAWKNLSIRDLRFLGISPSAQERIMLEKRQVDLAAYMQRLQLKNIQLITIGDPQYPPLLRTLYDPPLVLYAQGNVQLLRQPAIAIVGTRQPTSYGVRATQQLVRELALTDCVVVSGLAMGIDAAAHEACLQHGVPTIAVLGTGIDLEYPVQNRQLRQNIVAHGLVISEYALDTKPLKWHFPRRNRIITGLSRATFVMEGALTSGAMISGRLALEQNRDVYALPGSIFSELSVGPNWLIAQGARPYLSTAAVIEDVFSGAQLSLLPPLRPLLTGVMAVVFNAIAEDAEVLFDILLETCGLTYGSLCKVLAELELAGYIRKLSGKRYVRT